MTVLLVVISILETMTFLEINPCTRRGVSRYPAVVAAAYAASAPVGFYAQQVEPHDYYKIVTESAERAVSSSAHPSLHSLPVYPCMLLCGALLTYFVQHSSHRLCRFCFRTSVVLSFSTRTHVRAFVYECMHVRSGTCTWFICMHARMLMHTVRLVHSTQVPGCPAAVRATLALWMNEKDMKAASEVLGLCSPLPAYIDDIATLQQEVNMVVMRVAPARALMILRCNVSRH